jgi:predicted nucleic acid-binding Zn ribbon protein
VPLLLLRAALFDRLLMPVIQQTCSSRSGQTLTVKQVRCKRTVMIW